MNPEERRQFVREHRTAIFGYPRKHTDRRCRSSTT